MHRVVARLVRLAPSALAVTLLGAPLQAAGFSVFEQGSKAMGMAGAFTAQADDPSTLFHNVGGLGFFDERAFAAGATLITSSGAEFTGEAPFAGLAATSRSFTELPPHFYWIEPLGGGWNFGLAVNTPFGLSTEWDGDRFEGRFISSKAVLHAVDVSPNVGFRFANGFGLGFGLVARFSEVELHRSQAAINPFDGLPTEIAKVVLQSDVDSGIGWQIGFLHRVNESFSWGVSYRSAVETDFSGDGRLTQVRSGNAAFDQVIAAALPFNQPLPIRTELEYPDGLSVGVAVALSPIWLVEVDANQTGWSSFDRVQIDFASAPALDTVLHPQWRDADHYRIGFRRTNRSNTEWRFGVVFDESPQPDENVGPLLPDADREAVTIGWGRRGARTSLDLALMFAPFDERTTLVNEDNFNGTYDTTAWLFGATVGW